MIEWQFLIDLKEKRVFCRTCSGECDSITIPEYTIYMCPDYLCQNKTEMTYSPSSEQWIVKSPGTFWKDPKFLKNFNEFIKASMQQDKIFT